MKVKNIDWSKEFPPNSECNYNHVKGKTPLGDFLISWKGWKDSPIYDVEHIVYGGYRYNLGSLDDAKEEAQKRYTETVLSCIEL
ncbi:MAG: hypothetical protein BMS9Abin11_1586 [Gammaproteobacteria bacterium]|nr:MAG: hypothetical protein BMS9Abin11_1586 [Gammaproteobacteria bacterium]